MDSQMCVGIFIGIIIVVVVLALMRGRSSSSSSSKTAAPSDPATGKLKKGMSKTAEPSFAPKIGDKHTAKAKAVAAAEHKSKDKDAGLHKKRVEAPTQKTIGVKRIDDDRPGKKSKSGGMSKSRVDDEPRKKGKFTKENAEESDDGSRGVMK